MNPAEFSASLRRALSDPSLIKERQRQRAAFSPSLSYGRHFGPALPGVRPAAVLALIEIDRHRPWRDWTIPLTMRPEHLPSHPGQISLPGGRLEVGESPRMAAEREFNEELGIDAFPGKVLGALQSLYVYNSNYRVTPFVAWSDPLGDLTPCNHEVARLIHLPLGLLLDGVATPPRAEVGRSNIAWSAPIIQIGADQVWGATAIILGELRAVLAEALSVG